MSDDVVLRLYFVKEDFFPFRIKNPGFSILQSDVNVIEPGFWLLKINHNKTTKNVLKLSYDDLLKFTSGIKNGQEVSVDFAKKDFDFNYNNLVNNGKVRRQICMTEHRARYHFLLWTDPIAKTWFWLYTT